MPTVESIRKLVQRNEGVAFVPHMCVQQELEQGTLREIKVKDFGCGTEIYLVYPAHRTLSHAARAFLELSAQTMIRRRGYKSSGAAILPPSAESGRSPSHRRFRMPRQGSFPGREVVKARLHSHRGF